MARAAAVASACDFPVHPGEADASHGERGSRAARRWRISGVASVERSSTTGPGRCSWASERATAPRALLRPWPRPRPWRAGVRQGIDSPHAGQPSPSEREPDREHGPGHAGDHGECCPDGLTRPGQAHRLRGCATRVAPIKRSKPAWPRWSRSRPRTRRRTRPSRCRRSGVRGRRRCGDRRRTLHLGVVHLGRDAVGRQKRPQPVGHSRRRHPVDPGSAGVDSASAPRAELREARRHDARTLARSRLGSGGAVQPVDRRKTHHRAPTTVSGPADAFRRKIPYAASWNDDRPGMRRRVRATVLRRGRSQGSAELQNACPAREEGPRRGQMGFSLQAILGWCGSSGSGRRRSRPPGPIPAPGRRSRRTRRKGARSTSFITSTPTVEICNGVATFSNCTSARASCVSSLRHPAATTTRPTRVNAPRPRSTTAGPWTFFRARCRPWRRSNAGWARRS